MIKKVFLVLLVAITPLTIIIQASRPMIAAQYTIATPTPINAVFPTPAIAQEIATRLGKTVDATIVQSDLNNITTLNLTNKGLTQDELLEIENVLFPNLRTLTLDGNLLTRLLNFDNMPGILNISYKNNNISGNVIIPSMELLTHIRLENNLITSIEFEGEMKGLNTLYLTGNPIKTLPSFNGEALFLRFLVMSQTGLEGVVKFDVINTPLIKRFYADDTNISTLDLYGLNLDALSVNNANIQEIINAQETSFVFGVDISNNNLMSLPVAALSATTTTYYTNQERFLEPVEVEFGADANVVLPIMGQLKDQLNSFSSVSVLSDGDELVTNIIHTGNSVTLPTSLLTAGNHTLTIEINGGNDVSGYTYVYPILVNSKPEETTDNNIIEETTDNNIIEETTDNNMTESTDNNSSKKDNSQNNTSGDKNTLANTGEKTTQHMLMTGVTLFFGSILLILRKKR